MFLLCGSEELLCFPISNQILKAHKTELKMQEMLKNMDFYVTPVLNMDGYMYTWENNGVGARVQTILIQFLLEGCSELRLSGHRWAGYAGMKLY